MYSHVPNELLTNSFGIKRRKTTRDLGRADNAIVSINWFNCNLQINTPTCVYAPISHPPDCQFPKYECDLYVFSLYSSIKLGILFYISGWCLADYNSEHPNFNSFFDAWENLSKIFYFISSSTSSVVFVTANFLHDYISSEVRHFERSRQEGKTGEHRASL
jgi:hypothetical protein